MHSRPKQSKPPGYRRLQVERILYEMGWEELSRLDEWDGEDLEFLRKELNEEEYRSLIDRLDEHESEEH